MADIEFINRPGIFAGAFCFRNPYPRHNHISYQRCTYCGSQLHTVANCPETWGGSSRRANLRCGYCGGQGHTSSACRHNATSARRRTLNDDFYLD